MGPTSTTSSVPSSWMWTNGRSMFSSCPRRPQSCLLNRTEGSIWVSSVSCFVDFPVIFTTSELPTFLPSKGIPIVVTGPASEALTMPMGVSNDAETSPCRTHPNESPERLMGRPIVSCFTVSLAPPREGPLPSLTMNGGRDASARLIPLPSLSAA